MTIVTTLRLRVVVVEKIGSRVRSWDAPAIMIHLHYPSINHQNQPSLWGQTASYEFFCCLQYFGCWYCQVSTLGDALGAHRNHLLVVVSTLGLVLSCIISVYKNIFVCITNLYLFLCICTILILCAFHFFKTYVCIARVYCSYLHFTFSHVFGCVYRLFYVQHCCASWVLHVCHIFHACPLIRHAK